MCPIIADVLHLQQAEVERSRAREATKEAEDARERIVAEAKQKSQEILDRARLAAQQECTELRQEALKEIKAILTRVETIRAATGEELETQRIFTNIAKLKATSTAMLAQPSHQNDGSASDLGSHASDESPGLAAEAPVEDISSQEGNAAPGDVGTNGDSPVVEAAKAEGSIQRSAATKGKIKKPSK